jgi:hypothetical protein
MFYKMNQLMHNDKTKVRKLYSKLNRMCTYV